MTRSARVPTLVAIAIIFLTWIPAGHAVPAEKPSMAAVRAEWNKPAMPFRVIDNVYFVGTRELGAWLIRTSDGLVLLDGALPESVPLIERNIRGLGFKIRDVRILLNSHAHFDHSGGLAQLKRDTGAQLLASEGDRVSLETGTYLGSEDVTAMSAPPVKVDRVIADGEAVRLGDTALTALVMPGHTRGCTSWLLPVHDHGVARQAIFYCSTSVAANRLAPNPQYPGIVDDYRATFARLASVHADVFLSNHKDFFSLWEKRARLGKEKRNPFVDPAELQAFVASSRADFEVQLARQQDAARSPHD